MRRKSIFGILAVLFGVATVPAATLHVPSEYPTIQAGVDAAQAGDTVLVAPGVYDDVTHTPGGGDTTKCVVVMKSDITLMGSGPGQTIIDAQLLGRGIHCSGVTGSVIRDLTIRNAFAQVYGAAIFCTDGSSPTIDNCEIVNNMDGGIICLNGSSPQILNCDLLDNEAKQGGGLAIEVNCSPYVSGCTITGNAAPSGAGVFIRDGSQPTLEDCVIANNTINALNGSGGGITIINAQPTILDCEITDNVSSGAGGGIAIFDNAVVTVTNTLIRGNSTTASYGPGGGVHVDYSSVTLDGCIIARNHAEGSAADGGGLYAILASSVVITQCTFAANVVDPSSGFGAGISVFMTSPQISKSIIAFNVGGKGLYCADGSSVPVVSCTDIYGNETGDEICGTDAGGNFSLDPLFCDLAGDDFRLQTDSPCAPGNHPDGPTACDGDRLGGGSVGCGPGAAPEPAGPGERVRILAAPNPFAGETMVRFRIPSAGPVRLDVVDVQGRRVRTLAEGWRAVGWSQVVWDGRDAAGQSVASGSYFYVLRYGDQRQVGRLVLLR
jgi:parallel beta-helix repeat protein